MLVFTYGTLKRGKPLSGWMKNAEFISDGFTSKVKLFLPNDKFPYPFCVTSDDSSGVFGEVYKIDEKQLEVLDMVEGYPDMYDRIEIEVTLTKGVKETCYIYVLNMKFNEEDFNSSLKY